MVCVNYCQTEWNEGHKTAKHSTNMTAEGVDIQDKPVGPPVTHEGNPQKQGEQPTSEWTVYAVDACAWVCVSSWWVSQGE